jgi:surface antigen
LALRALKQDETPREAWLVTLTFHAVRTPDRNGGRDIGMRLGSTVTGFAIAFALVTSAGAASAVDIPVTSSSSPLSRLVPEQTRWQCVQFARLFSGIQLFGDARTWWSAAMGKYARGFTPQTGSVLVFKPHGVMRRGHVAVVSQILTDRIIQVTHANWSPIDGRRGKVEKDVTVIDVSHAGDWSQVKVFYHPTGDLGATVYPTYGFIYSAAKAAIEAADDAGQRMGAALVGFTPSP